MTRGGIRWTRAVVAGSVLAGIGILIVLVPSHWDAYQERRAARIEPILATDDEQRQVLAAVFDHVRFGGVPPPPPAPGEPAALQQRDPVVLVTTTVALGSDENEPGSATQPPDTLNTIPFAGGEALISERFRRELVAANRNVAELDCPRSTMVLCTTRDAYDAIFQGDGWWNDFYNRYPDTAGSVRVSQAVLSSDRNQALVFVSHQCDGTCGTSSLLLLKHTKSAWTLEAQEITSMR